MEPSSELEELEEVLEELDQDLEADPIEVNRLKVYRQMLLARIEGQEITMEEAEARAFDEECLGGDKP